MKKIIILLICFICSASAFSQATQWRLGIDSTSGNPKLYHDTIIPKPNLPNYYLNGYGAFVNLRDTTRTYISLTTTGTSGAATYNNSTGVFNIPQYAGTTYTATTPITLTGSAFGMVNQGTTTTVLHGNASGNPAFSAVGLTTDVSGILPVANGGTGTATPGLVAGTNITSITGTWPNQTINASGGSSGWNLTGNSGITAVTNFLGTTDAQSIYFKTNGVTRAKFDSAGYSFIDGAYIGRGNIATNNSTRITNLAFGDSALYTSSTTGGANTAIGNFALARDTAINNTAVGYEALKSNISGSNNTAVGYGALKAHKPTGFLAEGNTAIGYNALLASTNGHYNTAGGFNAMLANTTGAYNTAFGTSSLSANLTSNYSAAFGHLALQNSTAANNTGMGAYALNSVTTGNENVGVGEAAGYGMTQGTYNVFIGGTPGSNTGITTGSYNTIIGNDIAAIGNVSNTVLISDGQQKRRLYSNSSWQTGIRYTAPSAILQLAPGQIWAGNAPLKLTHTKITTTNATQAGSIVTLTFAAQSQTPFTLNDSITVAGITPSGYNGTFKVTGGTTTTVTYITGSGLTGQTVAGTIETGFLTTTAESGAVERDTKRLYFTGDDGVRGMIHLTFTGTAAPATTPYAVGDMFVDTTNKKIYVATGTASSADWTILN